MRIRFQILVILGFFGFSFNYHKKINEDAIKQAIIKVGMDHQKSWANADIGQFIHSYGKFESFTFIGTNGLTRDWQNTFENKRKRCLDKKTIGRLSSEIIKIDMTSNHLANLVDSYTLCRQDDQTTG